MAARHQLRALRNHPGLNRFCIPSEKITCRDRQIGAGSYGRVVELNIDGTICAGKIMHEVLIQGKEILQKYVEECQLMSDIRHPNIVQFLGLCFLPNSSVPVLVLERLLTSFDDLLDKKPKEENRIPLCIKRSILADVAKGLIYLHNRNPPVIHRDLSARNVLLNSSMQAKISDLGNARIIDFRLAQRSMSRMPGAPTYMPPEAFGDKSQCYGPQLDSFSFGHLTLFAVTQVFPCEILPPTYPDPKNPGCVVGRTEIERRQEYIKLLHQQLERRHPLVQLVNQCLNNDPSQRPSAKELLRRLQDMEAQIENPYGHLTTLEMMRKVEDKDAEARQLQCNLDTKSDMWQREKEMLLSQFEQLQMRNKEICLLHKDRLELELKNVKQKCDELCRCRKERDQARKETEELQTKLQEYETRICRYRKERDQARKETKDLQAKLPECETRINRYCKERDQARKLREDLQAKLLECETRINRYREERDQARKLTEDLQAKLLERETRINHYREERDQARKQTEDLQAKLLLRETRTNRYREERDQAQKQTEDLQTKLQEYETRMCEEHDQAQNQTEELQAKLQQHETEMYHYREERDQARKQTEDLQAKLLLRETRTNRYREERDQAQKQTEELQAKLQEYKTRICHYREEHDRVQKQTEKIQAKLQEYETRMCLYHEEHTEATASARSISLDEQVNTLQSQAQAAAIIDCSDSDRLYSAVPSAHSEKCGLLHARDKPGGQLSGTNEFKTVVRTRRGLVQMWMQKPTTPLNHKHKPQVIVKQSDEHYYETGRLMYTGQLSGKEIAGIQLDCHRGHTSGNHNDGSNYLGKQYFICPAGYALYLPLSMVYVEA